MIERMREALGLNDKAIGQIQEVLDGSRFAGQGNPRVSKHPLFRSECWSRRRDVQDEQYAECGAYNMVPIDVETPSGTDASATASTLCIDRYEFPNVPCEYPLVWVRPREAAQLCEALGKRLCDAHEWEGACAGQVKDARLEYDFGKRRMDVSYFHNRDRELVWAYGGDRPQHQLCATGSAKSPKCVNGGYRVCGSNTYPAGSFVECRTPSGIYDLHGNVAEHMNYPQRAAELGSKGGQGVTEMKGSWFVFAKLEAHADDCRWRAPAWHETRVDSPEGHYNYHLGFRCCKDVRAP